MRFTISKLIQFTVLVAIAAPGLIQARDSYFEPITNLQLSYNDNVTLVPNNPTSQTRGRLSLGLDYTSAESPNDRFFAGVLVQVDRYTDETLDTENYTANLGYFKGTPRRDFNLALRIRRDTVLTGEFDDTGVLGRNPTQERLDGRFDADWVERFTARWAGELGIQYERREYPGGDDTRFAEFDNWFPNAVLDYSLSERTSIFGQVGSNFYNPLNTPTDQEQRSDRLLVGFRGSFSERASYLASVGWENFDFENIQGVAAQQQDTDGAAWNIWGRWNNELSSWTLGTSRLGQGSSRGTLTRVTRGYLRFERELTARLSFFLRGELGKRQFPSDPNREGIDREYAEFDTGLRWAFAEKWNAGLRYRYRQQEFIQRGTGAASAKPDSNTVFATIAYEYGRI